MADQLATVARYIERCLHGLEQFESYEYFSPRMLARGENIFRQIGQVMDGSISRLEDLERELKDEGSAFINLPPLRDHLLALRSAAKCLEVQTKIIKSLMEWSEDEARNQTADEGLALFMECLEEAQRIEPTDTIPELCQAQQALLENLQSYKKIFTKLKEGRERGDVEMLEEASADLASLESKQLLESIEMYSMPEGLEKAKEMLYDLRKEAGTESGSIKWGER